MSREMEVWTEWQELGAPILMGRLEPHGDLCVGKIRFFGSV